MPPHECDQVKRLEKIELTMDKTVEEFAKIRESLSEIKTLLGERILKYDDHIKTGEIFRAQIANTTLGLLVTVVIVSIGAVYAYGGLAKQVEVNTDKWAKHHDEARDTAQADEHK